jgi:hypothetical protein
MPRNLINAALSILAAMALASWLAICKRRVGMMGGRITVESSLDRGSTFTDGPSVVRLVVNLPQLDFLLRLGDVPETGKRRGHDFHVRVF